MSGIIYSFQLSDKYLLLALVKVLKRIKCRLENVNLINGNDDECYMFGTCTNLLKYKI